MNLPEHFLSQIPIDKKIIGNETHYTYLKKSHWGDGEWLNEPDKVSWVDDSTGYHCIVRRSPSMGAWCGYVGVPPSHPCYELSYEDVDSEYDLKTHHGLTFSSHCTEEKETGICHDSTDKVWWLGFDCGHSYDLLPLSNWMKSITHHIKPIEHDLKNLHNEIERECIYRNLEYVKQETISLAKQLKAIK